MFTLDWAAMARRMALEVAMNGAEASRTWFMEGSTVPLSTMFSAMACCFRSWVWVGSKPKAADTPDNDNDLSMVSFKSGAYSCMLAALSSTKSFMLPVFAIFEFAMCTNDLSPAVAMADPSFPLPEGAGATTGAGASAGVEVEAPLGAPAAFAAARSDARLALLAFRNACACAV